MKTHQKTIFLVSLIFCLLSGIYFFQGYKCHTAQVKEIIKVNEDTFDTIIKSVEDFSFTPYSQRIENLLATSPQIVAAFAEKDKEQIYRLTLPKFKALQQENRFFHIMSFHLPDGTSLLRMHNPDFFGDNVSTIRSLISYVHKEKHAREGFKIGSDGPYYSTVRPVFYQNQYIGALEFGIKTQHLLAALEKRINAPITSFFRQDLLARANPGQRNEWLLFGNYCLRTQNQEIYGKLPKSLRLDAGVQHITAGGQTYVLHSGSQFNDFQDKSIGGIVILQDITTLLEQQSRFLWRSGMLIVGLCAAAAMALYLGFGMIVQSLEKTIAKASYAKKEWENTFDAIPDLIAILDKDFTIIRTNKALPTMLGLSMQEVLGSPCHHCFCGTDKMPKDCPYHTLMREQKTCRNEIYCKKINCYFDIILSPLLDEEGAIIGAVHISRNITDRKFLQQELEEKQLYLSSILEASKNTAIIATDTDLKVKYCNRETEKLLGLPVRKILGQSIIEIHCLFGRDSTLQISKAIELVRQRGSHSFTMERDDFFLNTQITAITKQDIQLSGMLLMARDVTKQNKAEKLLLETEKLKTIGLLASGVAHELNNILSGIICYPELMLQDLPPNSALRDPITRIQSAGQKAADVVDDLLTISRSVTKYKEVISINNLVREYLDSPKCLQLTVCHRNISIYSELDPQCWSCSCSPAHIKKIITNLVNNAFDVMDDKGNITIVTRNQAKRPLEAENSVKGSNFVVLEVRDNGPGMPHEVLQRIFEPFYSTKKLGHSGTGLGLAVVWNVAKDHGGLVTVKSNNNGTVFTLYFPATTAESGEKRVENNDNLDNLKGNGTLLVVDDDSTQRDLATRMLSVFDYTVHTVNSGEAAIEWLQEQEADLLLLDMALGEGINGLETFKQALVLYPDQRAIIVSGLADKLEVKKALSLGANSYLRKPYSLKEVGHAVQKAIAETTLQST